MPLVPIDSVNVRPAIVSVALVAVLVPVPAIVASAIAAAETTPPELVKPVSVWVAKAVAPARIVSVAVDQPDTIASAMWFLAAVFNDGIMITP